tara:strand:+ start:3216 stop:3704 length:489 start_codon:yes stop_codon:yes gene_type:complete
MIEKIFILLLIIFFVYLSIYNNFNYIFYVIGIGLIFLLGFMGLNRVVSTLVLVLYISTISLINDQSNVILYFVLLLSLIISYKYINKIFTKKLLRIPTLILNILIGVVVTISYLYLVDLFGYKINLENTEKVDTVPLDEIEENNMDLNKCGMYQNRKFMRYV